MILLPRSSVAMNIICLNKRINWGVRKVGKQIDLFAERFDKDITALDLKISGMEYSKWHADYSLLTLEAVSASSAD